MFDLFDFTPIGNDPFKQSGGNVMPPVQRAQSAVVEEAKQYGLGLKNALQAFMEPRIAPRRIQGGRQ